MKMKTVLTGGKFNRIHPGHVWLLSRAKEHGHLVVVIANDSHNKSAYSVSAKIRKKNLEKLQIADKIVIGHSKRFFPVLKRFHPDVIVLGYDQKLPKDTIDIVKKMKIKIVKEKRHKDYSTRKLHKIIK